MASNDHHRSPVIEAIVNIIVTRAIMDIIDNRVLNIVDTTDITVIPRSSSTYLYKTLLQTWAAISIFYI